MKLGAVQAWKRRQAGEQPRQSRDGSALPVDLVLANKAEMCTGGSSEQSF